MNANKVDPEVMVINTLEDWQSVLQRGAVVLWETKYFKVFRLDGKLWRAMPKWRRAWRFYVDGV